MSSVAVQTSAGFDSRDFWVDNAGQTTEQNFTELTSSSGGPLAGQQQLTYETFEFVSGGLTYRYSGSFTIEATYGLLTGTVHTYGTYDHVEVLSGDTVLASNDIPPLDVDFGTFSGGGILDIVTNLLGGVLDLLFGGSNPSSPENLFLDPTPNLPALAYGDGVTATGGAGDDSLFGYALADVLIGGAGRDLLSGGAQNDTYYVDNGGDKVVEAVSSGTDVVFASVNYSLNTLQEIEELRAISETATTGIDLVGNEFAQTLAGDAGDNALNGRGGADIMVGLAGNDSYTVDNAGDQVIEGKDDGTDIVRTSVSYTLGLDAEVEEFRTTSENATSAINLTGNRFAQKIVGNAGDNTINGGGGADAMAGLSGNDIYQVDDVGDQVNEGINRGTDIVFTSVSYTLGAGQEIEELRVNGKTTTTDLALTGNAFANRIVGNAGDNVLDGQGGNDALFGLGGNDTFVFSTRPGVGNVDRIGDFAAVDDTIQLSKAVFTALGTGALSAAAFKDVSVGGAVDADDRILYSSKLGTLSYDADGSGGSAAVVFAVLDNKAALTFNDFLVV